MLLQVVAQRYVLRTAQLRSGEFLAAQVRGTLDVGPWSHDELSSPAGRSSDNAQRLAMTFHVAVDSRRWTYIANINLIGKESLNFRRASIEDLRLYLNLRTQITLKCAPLYSHYSDSMRQVGKVTQADRQWPTTGSRALRTATCNDGQGHEDHKGYKANAAWCLH